MSHAIAPTALEQGDVLLYTAPRCAYRLRFTVEEVNDVAEVVTVYCHEMDQAELWPFGGVETMVAEGRLAHAPRQLELGIVA